MEGTWLLLAQFGLAAVWVALNLGSTTVFVAMCPVSFWDAGEGTAGTLCARALEGALDKCRGIMNRARLALQYIFFEGSGHVYQISLGEEAFMGLQKNSCQKKKIVKFKITMCVYVFIS